MKVGIPREVKNHEYRVAITPAGVHELVAQRPRGLRRERCRRRLLDHRRRLRRRRRHDPGARPTTSGPPADLILKVKEPIAQEYDRMREGQTLFTYLHLAADKPLTEELVKRKVTGIAYETVELPDRSLPLLAPMSEVAGRLAPQVGAHTLMRAQGGRGVLMGGVPGRLRREGRRHRRRRRRAERRRDRPRHAGRGAAARPQRRPAAPDGRASTRATARRSRRTRTRSRRPSSTPTW